MAKKKKRKEEKPALVYSVEIIGLILLLLGIVGFGDFGIVGEFIKNFAIFLCGQFYFLLLLICLIVGFYMVAKRKNPAFSNERVVGIYIILVALLMLAHQNYITENTSIKNVVSETFNSITISFENNTNVLGNESLIATGGGMLGAILSGVSGFLFGKTGTYVIVVIVAIFGVIMLFNITLADMIKVIIKPFKKLKKEKGPNIKLPDYKDDLVYENMPKQKMTISSLEDLEVASHTNESVAPNEQLLMNFNQSTKPNSNQKYELPSIYLLDAIKNKTKASTTEFITLNHKILERVLTDFDIEGKVVQVYVGPTFTQYELEIKAGTRVNRILAIDREIALALGAKNIRIEAPIPGKHTIGIEVPNKEATSVQIKEIISKIPSKYENSKLLAALGKDIMGEVQFLEIDKMPHLLVAGATGSGKSVCINSIITSILMRATPDEVKMILIDPKKVEMAVYEGIPHLMRPVVTSPKHASEALRKVVQEMDDRYDLFNKTGTKNITTYNEMVERKGHKEGLNKIPYIVVIIDELADLMLVARKEVESSIMRIAQLARAAGIHLIVATQRPSADIITGLIKANIPSRVSFSVSSSIDSRTILDATGAEKLLGKGDMLFSPMGENTPRRIQGCFISDQEVERVASWCKKQREAEFDEKFVNLDNNEDNITGGSSPDMKSTNEESDPIYNDVLEFAIRTGKISASLVQRKFSVGYNRAARLIDILEEKGIIGPQNGSKPRDVLVELEQKEDM